MSRRSPVDQLLEVAVYAPIGLAYVVVNELPDLVQRGRQQVQRLVADGQGLAAMAGGLLDRGDRAADRPAPDRPVASRPPRTPRTEPSPEVFPEIAAAAPPAADATTLAIPGYSALSASQVLGRLEGLTREQLEEIRVYEAGTRHRKTILGRVAQLLADSPG